VGFGFGMHVHRIPFLLLFSSKIRVCVVECYKKLLLSQKAKSTNKQNKTMSDCLLKIQDPEDVKKGIAVLRDSHTEYTAVQLLVLICSSKQKTKTHQCSLFQLVSQRIVTNVMELTFQ
jgi:hypothetical protein